MARQSTSEANGNGKIRLDRGWLQTLVTLATIVAAASAAWVTLRCDVKANCIKNTEQDTRISTNTDRIGDHTEQLGRVDERWKAINDSLTKIDRKLDDLQRERLP
jgi:hypothetical protein